MRVIGTSGHVDHGKSTLVRRLTGIDPDRLAQEKARQMTIDLGFAWLTLPDGEQVGIIDVPGHRDFIENMLAGVGGIDAALLVIAADEGVMPQTREHLTILDLLGVESGMVVLTKCDLVDDPDWLGLVETEVRDALHGTTLSDAPVLPVSARTGDGIDALLARLSDVLSELPRQVDHGAPRLSIDRVFTMSGFGTVVTGTLLGGSLRVGDEIELQPTGLRGRVRGLQSYRQSVDIATPGSRVAVNVAGVERHAIARGHSLARPGQLAPTRLVDARFRHVADAGRPLKHNAEVKLFAGAAETTAHVRLLDAEILMPGQAGWLQLRLDAPLALAQGDHYILRYPSPGQTIGGGMIVDAHPARRWRRFQPDRIATLQTRLQGSPAELLAQAALDEPMTLSALRQRSGCDEDTFAVAVREALDRQLVVEFSDGTLWSAQRWRVTVDHVTRILADFHRAEPLRPGMPREELRSRVRLKQQTLALILDSQNAVVADGNTVRLSTHAIQFTQQQQARIHELERQLAAAPYAPPSYADAASLVGDDVLRALIDLHVVIQVSPDVIFADVAYRQLTQTALDMIDTHGSLSTAAFRDRFSTTRKYAIALLEHLDAIGWTKRDGDNRVRGRNAPPVKTGVFPPDPLSPS